MLGVPLLSSCFHLSCVVGTCDTNLSAKGFHFTKNSDIAFHLLMISMTRVKLVFVVSYFISFHQLIEYFVSHRIHGFLRLSSSQEVSFASVFEPTEFVASSATTAGAVFTKALDTSLWVLHAKLRNSSSDSAHCMGKSVSSVDFV